jgi:outer membrane protein assembly factor BamB
MFRLLCLCTFAASVCAADWPMGGRDHTRNPVTDEKSAPTDWQFPLSGPVGGKYPTPAKNLRWIAEVGGDRAIGGPVVAGGLVWVGTNTDYDPDKMDEPDRSVLVAVREKDGKVVYRRESKRLKFGPDWPGQGMSGSPLAEKDRLWFVTNRREVVCLDVGPLQAGKGEPKEVWKLDMPKELKVVPRALMIPGADTLGSPAAYKDFLYVPTGNGYEKDNRTLPAPDAPCLVCLHKDTGKVVWTDNSPGKAFIPGHYASPLVIEVNGKGRVIHPQADGWVRAFDAETGNLVWKLNVNRPGVKDDDRLYVVATPVFANGRVYFGVGLHPEACGGAPGRLFCVNPAKAAGDVSAEVDTGKAEGKPNPKSAVAWEYEGEEKDKTKLELMVASVAVANGFVIAVDFYGQVHCLDEKTGKRHWVHTTKDGQTFGHPLIADGKIYVTPRGGAVQVLELSKTKKVLAKVECDQLITAPPVFANGVLYVLSELRLYAVGPPK